MIWILSLVYFAPAMGTNGIGMYLPSVVDSLFPDSSKTQVGMVAALPPLCAIVGMVLIGRHSDHTGERRWHLAVSGFIAALGCLLVIACPQPVLKMLGLAVAYIGMFSMLPTFWALATSFLSGTAAAGGIAIINSLGNLGGFGGTAAMGAVKDATSSFAGGFVLMAAVFVAGGALALIVRHDRRLEPK